MSSEFMRWKVFFREWKNWAWSKNPKITPPIFTMARFFFLYIKRNEWTKKGRYTWQLSMCFWCFFQHFCADGSSFEVCSGGFWPIAPVVCRMDCRAGASGNLRGKPETGMTRHKVERWRDGWSFLGAFFRWNLQGNNLIFWRFWEADFDSKGG